MIRIAKIVDLVQLAELFDQYRIFYRKASDLPGAMSFLKERLELGDSYIYVYEEAGKLLGFVQLYPLFSSTRMRRIWVLNDLFVAPAHRGKGLSILLINVGKQLCINTNACGLMLETEKSNTIGNQLYPRAGFKQNQDSNFYEWTTEE